MKSKYLEKKIVVNRNEFQGENNELMQLEYYLVESEIPGDLDMEGKKAFGIEIVKISDGNSIETQCVDNFSCNKVTVRDTINKLANNIVTPCSLYFILEDMLSA